ncbi:MAG: hypothetical protein RR744_00500 [Cellulosilyticaceae bacterium]
MAGTQIDVKGFSDLVMEEIKKDVAMLPFMPSYTCYIVADENGNFDPASEKYVGLKHKTSTLAGIDCIVKKVTYDEFRHEMVQVTMREEPLRAMLQLPACENAIKMFYGRVKAGLIIDVDHLGDDVLHDMWDGKFDRIPGTPRGIMALLFNELGSLEGKRCAVVGSRSKTTGQYLIPLLQRANATVSMYHSRSEICYKEFEGFDVIISCVGKPGFINNKLLDPHKVQVLVDVGVGFADGKVKGDFHEEVRPNHLYTPYVNGVGLLTRTMLCANVVDSYIIGID